MNTTILMGRATADIATKGTEKPYARFILAVDRQGEGTDFIPCVAFGKTAESLAQWVKKGTKILVSGRIQTGSYEGANGTVYTMDVIVGTWEFAQSKNSEGFAKADEEGLPFK